MGLAGGDAEQPAGVLEGGQPLEDAGKQGFPHGTGGAQLGEMIPVEPSNDGMGLGILVGP